MNWIKLSTIGAWSGGVAAVADILLHKYMGNTHLPFLIIGSFGLALFLASEIAQLIEKIKSRKKKSK